MNTSIPFIMRTIFSLITILALSYGIVGTAFAQVPQGTFIVQPAKVELSIAPSKEGVASVTLMNGTQSPVEVKLNFEDVAPTDTVAAGDDPARLLGDARGPFSIKDLVSAPKTTFTILSGEQLSLPLTVRIPAGTEPGGLFGSAVFTVRPVFGNAEPKDANVAIETRIATLLFVRVEGAAHEEGKLINLGTLFGRTTPSPSESTPITFHFAYENSGNVHLDPYGQLTVRGLWGEPKKLRIDPLAVYPGTTRTREIAFTDSLMPGFYRAQLELNRGYGDIIDTMEASFIVVPGKGAQVAILIGIVILVLLLTRSLRISRHFVS